VIGMVNKSFSKAASMMEAAFFFGPRQQGD